MKIVRYPQREKWEELIQRPEGDNKSLKKSVRKILSKVKEEGDKAIKKFSKEFDKVKVKHLAVNGEEINLASLFISEELKTAIRTAKQNIENFHRSQLEEEKKIETMPGVSCWRRSVPVEKIGLYIPGGSAPLFSSVLMLGVPASIAGCKDVILCTPPNLDGSVSPMILFAAELCGIKKIFKVGGAQAIAAMAYGTDAIPKVSKIFGPGNQYVTCAKMLVQMEGIAIDIPAGPSELLVIGDDTAIPEFVAADLLSQAEHGTDSHVLFLTTTPSLVEKVMTALEELLGKLPRKDIARQVLKNSKVIITKNLDEAIELSNMYAPEHLILSISNAAGYIDRISNAGSVFIGNYSPESVGDYASGTNHTLPTSGYAVAHSGVSLDSFMKKISFQQLTKEGLINISETVMEMAAAEGLEAHKNAVAVRLKK